MKRAAQYAAVSVLLVGGGAFLLRVFYQTPAAQRAIVVAALVALVVQAGTWTIIQVMGREQVIAAWGVSALVRVVALVLFAFVGPRSVGLPLEPAALSLAVFLFLTTLVEPLFLKS